MFSVLTSKVFGGLSVVLAVALAVVVVTNRATIAAYDAAINAPVTGWQARLSACTADLAVARGNTAVLGSSVGKQNEAVQSVQDHAAARYANGAAMRSDAALKAKQAAQLAAKLAKATATENMCASADALILETVK